MSESAPDHRERLLIQSATGRAACIHVSDSDTLGDVRDRLQNEFRHLIPTAGFCFEYHDDEHSTTVEMSRNEEGSLLARDFCKSKLAISPHCQEPPAKIPRVQNVEITKEEQDTLVGDTESINDHLSEGSEFEELSVCTQPDYIVVTPTESVRPRLECSSVAVSDNVRVDKEYTVPPSDTGAPPALPLSAVRDEQEDASLSDAQSSFNIPVLNATKNEKIATIHSPSDQTEPEATAPTSAGIKNARIPIEKPNAQSDPPPILDPNKTAPVSAVTKKDLFPEEIETLRVHSDSAPVLQPVATTALSLPETRNELVREVRIKALGAQIESASASEPIILAPIRPEIEKELGGEIRITALDTQSGSKPVTTALQEPEIRNKQVSEEIGAGGAQPDSTSLSEPTTTAPIPPEIKNELIRRDRLQSRNHHRVYGDRHLLRRHGADGIGKLGGGQQDTNPLPMKWHRNIWDRQRKRLPDYPFPKHIVASENGIADSDDIIDQEPNMEDFRYLCFSDLWQPNAPQYAAQPYAAVDYVSDYLRKNNLAFPIFLRRSLTSRHAKSGGQLLGWEYVGNYRAIENFDDDNGDEFSYWESAFNFSQASKNMIAKKIFESSKGDGYGRHTLDTWREKLSNALRDDKSPAAPQYFIDQRQPTEDEVKDKRATLAARARALGFKNNIGDEALSKLLVQVDEFHGQRTIKFVEYDERVYNYCKAGKTNRAGRGKMVKSAADRSAKAIDWYNFHDQQVTY